MLRSISQSRISERTACQCEVISQAKNGWHTVALSMILLLVHFILILRLGGLGILSCSVSLDNQFESAAGAPSVFELVAEQTSTPIQFYSSVDKLGRIKPDSLRKMAIHGADTYGGIKRFSQQDVVGEALDGCWQSLWFSLRKWITRFLADGAHWLMVSSAVLMALYLMKKKNAKI